MIGREELDEGSLSTEPNGDCMFSSIYQSLLFSNSDSLSLRESITLARAEAESVRQHAVHKIMSMDSLRSYLNMNLEWMVGGIVNTCARPSSWSSNGPTEDEFLTSLAKKKTDGKQDNSQYLSENCIIYMFYKINQYDNKSVWPAGAF